MVRCACTSVYRDFIDSSITVIQLATCPWGRGRGKGAIEQRARANLQFIPWIGIKVNLVLRWLPRRNDLNRNIPRAQLETNNRTNGDHSIVYVDLIVPGKLRERDTEQEINLRMVLDLFSVFTVQQTSRDAFNALILSFLSSAAFFAGLSKLFPSLFLPPSFYSISFPARVESFVR